MCMSLCRQVGEELVEKLILAEKSTNMLLQELVR